MESERIEALRSSANYINGELTEVLTELSFLRGEITFPKPVKFKSGVEITSFPEENVEAAIRNGVNKGEIFFGVDPNFKGQVFKVKRFLHNDTSGLVIFAIFPIDFKTRCDIDLGKPVEKVLKDVLAQVLFEDQVIAAENLKRGSYHSSETAGLVGIFRGKITF